MNLDRILIHQVFWNVKQVLCIVFLLKINPFVPNAPFLYSLKISENCKVFWCFQGVEKGCIGNKWVISAIYNSLELVLMILSYIGIFSFWKCYSDLEVSIAHINSARYTKGTLSSDRYYMPVYRLNTGTFSHFLT